MAWIDIAREVVDQHQYANVDPDTGERVSENQGMVLDAQTANLLVQIADKLNEANSLKFTNMKIYEAVHIAWKLVK